MSCYSLVCVAPVASCRCSSHLELFVGVAEGDSLTVGLFDPFLIGDRLADGAREGVVVLERHCVRLGRGGGGWGGRSLGGGGTKV